MSEPGTVSILSVGEGDTTLSFNSADPAEVERAKRIVTDMLRRGYALLVQVGADETGEPLYRRARAFDPKTCEYVIAGAPPDEQEAPQARKEPRARQTRKAREYRLPAAEAKVTAVGRVSGG